MEQKELRNKNNEIVNVEHKPTDKEVFEKVVEVMRENFIATFTKEGDTSLIIRFVAGLEFRLKIEEV